MNKIDYAKILTNSRFWDGKIKDPYKLAKCYTKIELKTFTRN